MVFLIVVRFYIISFGLTIYLLVVFCLLSGVRKVCWRPPCPDCTAQSLSSTHTSSYRGSRPRLHPPPLRLRPLPSTSTFPPRRPLPPHRRTPLLRANHGSLRSTQRRPTRPTPTRLCPPTPTRHRRPFTPTPTCPRRGRGSNFVFQLSFSGLFSLIMLKELKKENVSEMCDVFLLLLSPDFPHADVCKHPASNADMKDMWEA